MSKEAKIRVLKPAKDYDKRRMASCGLVALTIKVPIKVC